MAPQKFLVRIVRPVFRTAYFEVEGDHENQAANLAYDLASKLTEEQWFGRFDPESYCQFAHIVRTSQTQEGNQFSLLDFPDYALFTTEESSVMGIGASQPWMDYYQPMAVASMMSRWIDLIRDDRIAYYEESIQIMEDILKDWKGTEKVVPFKTPAQREHDIDLLEAALELAYVLKETD